MCSVVMGAGLLTVEEAAELRTLEKVADSF